MSSSFHSSRLRRSEQGFTLIEMIITIAILAFMSVGIYQAITEAFRIREKLVNEGDFYNTIRLSMAFIQRDIEMMYSPSILTVSPSPSPTQGLPNPNTAPFQQNQPNPSANPMKGLDTNTMAEMGQTSDFWLAATDNTGVRPSRFIGSDKKISFVSASHIRIYKDAPESDMMKVVYEFKKDSDAPEGWKHDDASVLVKTENTNVFDMDDKKEQTFAHTYPILHGVMKYKFRFYRQDKEEWFNSWDSDAEDTKAMYPDMVELTIEVHGPSSLTFQGKYLFRPEVPLRGLIPSG